MLRKMRAKVTLGTQGFTLIELMIVIAIIGILAAIAIPNFIAYRNKAYCAGTEKDAQSISSAIGDYFSVRSNRSVSKDGLIAYGMQETMSNANPWDLSVTVTANDADTIAILVTDASGRCPTEYMNALTAANDPLGYWDSGNSLYIKTIR